MNRIIKVFSVSVVLSALCFGIVGVQAESNYIEGKYAPLSNVAKWVTIYRDDESATECLFDINSVKYTENNNAVEVWIKIDDLVKIYEYPVDTGANVDHYDKNDAKQNLYLIKVNKDGKIALLAAKGYWGIKCHTDFMVKSPHYVSIVKGSAGDAIYDIYFSHHVKNHYGVVEEPSPFRSFPGDKTMIYSPFGMAFSHANLNVPHKKI